MGYTHYWTIHKDASPEQWAILCDIVKQMIEQVAYPVKRSYDVDNGPEINEERIVFNGVGEDGHEDFRLERTVLLCGARSISIR